MKKLSFLAALLISGAVYAISTATSATSVANEPAQAAMVSADDNASSALLKKYPKRGKLAEMSQLVDGAEILLANSNGTGYRADGTQDPDNTFLSSKRGLCLGGYNVNALNVLEGLSMDNVWVLVKTDDQTAVIDGETVSLPSFNLKHKKTGMFLAGNPFTYQGDSWLTDDQFDALPFYLNNITLGNDLLGVDCNGKHYRTQNSIRLEYYEGGKNYHFGPFWNYKVAAFQSWDDIGAWNPFLIEWDDSPLINIQYRMAELVEETADFKTGDIAGRYPQEMMDAFKAAVADCEAAIEEEAGDDAYIAKLTALEAAYQALVDSKIIGMEPIFKPGKQIAWDELKAGDKFILQIGLFYSNANLNGSLENYLQASMATTGGGGYGSWGGKGLLVSGNLDETCVFTLEEAPSQINADGEEVDAFYLKNVETGLYVGLDPNNPTALGTGDALWAAYVESTEDALSVTPFGSEGKVGGVSGTGGVNVSDASVRFKHFWTIEGGEGEDDTIWSANFGTVWSYGYASWRNDYDSFIWNAYELALDETWYGQLELKYKQIGGVTFAAGEDPGCFPEDLVTAYEDVCYEVEEALADERSDEEYQALTAKLQRAYDAVMEAQVQLVPGYYNIISGYSAFEEILGRQMAWIAKEDGFLYWGSFNEEDPQQVFKIERQRNKTWSIKSVTYGTYVGRNKNNDILLDDELVDVMLIESEGVTGRWHVKYQGGSLWYYTDAFGYGYREQGHVGNNSNGYDAGTYNWHFKLIPAEEEANVDARAEQVRCTGRLSNLLEEAVTTYNKAFSYTADKDSPLITDFGEMDEDGNTTRRGQITTEFGINDGNTMNLNDNEKTTQWYVAPTQTSAADYTSFDVNLEENPVQTFIINFSKSEKNVAYAPRVISIWARNSEEDDWTMIERIDNLPTSEAIMDVETNGIDLGQPYKYIRIKVEDQVNGGRSWGFAYFAISEFQMYPAVLNENASQYTYIDGLKDAADNLNKLMTAARVAVTDNNATDAQWEELRAAVDAVAALVGDPTDLVSELAEAYEYVEYYGAGEQYGQVTDEQYAAAIAVLNQAEAYDPDHLVKTDLEARREKVAEALATFKSQQRSIELNQWLYIINCDASEENPQFGKRLYAAATSCTEGDAYNTSDVVRHGYYDLESEATTDEGLLSTQWRAVMVGDTAIALQNRLNMMYLGGIRFSGVGSGLSTTPVPYKIAFVAPGQIQFICATMANANNKFAVTAATSGVATATSNHSANAAAAWTTELIDDNALEYGIIEVPNNKIAIYTMPFASEMMVAASEGAAFYQVVGMSDENSVQLQKLDDAAQIEAGMPVIIETGTAGAELEEGESAVVQLFTEVPTAAAYATEALTINGLVGTLNGTVLDKTGCGIIEDNTLKANDRAIIIKGGTGFIDPKLVTNIAGATADVTLTSDEALTAIKNALVNAGVKNGNIYTIDGKLVKAGQNAKGLQKGIYIIGNKKVAVK